MAVKATFIRDFSGSVGANSYSATVGTTIEMPEADAAYFAARQLVSISGQINNDPDAPHDVAVLIPANTVAAAKAVKSIAFTPSSLTIAADATGTLSAVATLNDGTTETITLASAFTSGNTDVFTISVNDTTGVVTVTGVAAGSAALSVLYKGVQSSATITVTAE